MSPSAPAATTSAHAAAAAAKSFYPLRYFFTPYCPFAHRSSIALHEVGLLTSIEPGSQSNGQLEVVHIDIRNKPDWYLRDINPKGKVPTLEITTGGKKEIMIESALIAEFVLQTHGSPIAIMQSTADDAMLRYRAGLVIDALSNQFNPGYFGLLREKDPSKQPAAKDKFLDAVKAVQAVLSHGGDYATGSRFTIADVIGAPFVARLPVLEHYRGFVVPDTPEYARFHAWKRALLARESVKATTAEMGWLIEQNKVNAV
ncbi:glutathione S-transferase [Catenaria anguillulae PL171]|uniref:Glutathione S-transferase n=1 Tax=Catenaria anguillulae PL171 TaxID=765915 RepID=A0A1Y2I386_9FUNG|nr:glutathione S-transferase [Catenaria anguillulae PL171]